MTDPFGQNKLGCLPLGFAVDEQVFLIIGAARKGAFLHLGALSRVATEPWPRAQLEFYISY